MGKSEIFLLIAGVAALVIYGHYANVEGTDPAPATPSASSVDSPQSLDTIFGQSVQRIFVVDSVLVVDGDSLKFTDQTGGQVDIRLAGIDAPEWNQRFGRRAKNTLKAIADRRSVTCYQIDTDRWQRSVAFVALNDGRNTFRTVNEAMLAEGLAWHAVKYNQDRWLAELQRQAQTQRRGLWADEKPIPPWQFRAGQTAGRNAKAPGAR